MSIRLLLSCDFHTILGKILPRKLRLRRSSKLMFFDPYTLEIYPDTITQSAQGQYTFRLHFICVSNILLKDIFIWTMNTPWLTRAASTRCGPFPSRLRRIQQRSDPLLEIAVIGWDTPRRIQWRGWSSQARPGLPKGCVCRQLRTARRSTWSGSMIHKGWSSRSRSQMLKLVMIGP